MFGIIRELGISLTMPVVVLSWYIGSDHVNNVLLTLRPRHLLETHSVNTRDRPIAQKTVEVLYLRFLPDPC